MLDALDFEDRIHQAYTESLEKQTVLPLIKQELQCKIQCNRLSRGEPELVLEEESPKVYEVTDRDITSLKSCANPESYVRGNPTLAMLIF